MEKIKNYVILGLLALLVISGGLNIYQNKVRKDAEIAAELARANSNTIIAENKAIAAQKQATIDAIRKNRALARVKDSIEIGALKQQISGKKSRLRHIAPVNDFEPNIIVTDTLGHRWEGTQEEFSQWAVQSLLKDSIISDQDVLISTLELRHSAEIIDLNAIIRAQSDQIVTHVSNSNELQTQLVGEQGKVRKEVRKKKFWRFLAGVGIATAGVLAVTSQ